MEKPKRGTEWIILLMLFMWVLTLLLSRSIYLKTSEITESSQQYRYSLWLKSEARPEDGFTSDEVQELRKVFSQEEISYYAFNELSVSAESYARTAQVWGVGGNCRRPNSVRLIYGAFLNEEDFVRKNNVAVIEDRLAKALFNSTDVVGLKIKILGSAFTVIGVAANDTSIAGMLTETDLPRLYVPLSTIEGKGMDFYITNIEAASSEASMEKAMFKDKIAVLGKNPEDFLVVDNNEMTILAKQRFDSVLFIIGLYCICLLIIFAMNKLKSMISHIRKETSNEYLWKAVVKCKRKLLLDSAKVGVTLAAIFLLWEAVSFNLYVQPEKLPTDPTSLTQFIEVIKAGLRDFFTWDYAYMLHEQCMLSLLDKCGSVLYALCLICTILLLAMSKYGKLHPKREIVRTAGALYLWFSAFIILSSVFILSLGMPIVLSVKDIMLLTGSLFTILLVQGGVGAARNENGSTGKYYNNNQG
ncbi:MAG: ABC transporter permease [Caulobacteraceae bacterium]